MTFEELLKERENTGIAKGITQGKADAILELLEEFGTVPEEIHTRIYAENDVEVLKGWLKLAAKTESIEEFQSKM